MTSCDRWRVTSTACHRSVSSESSLGISYREQENGDDLLHKGAIERAGAERWTVISMKRDWAAVFAGPTT